MPTAPTSRTRNRWGEGDRLRGEILDAASELLSTLDSEDGLTIRGVARTLGIAPASIYQHFKDRAALVTGLTEHEYERLRTTMSAATAPDDDPVTAVYAQAHAYCEFALANPSLYRLLGRMAGKRADPGQDVEGPLRSILDSLAEAFGRCERAGAALRVPPLRAASIVLVTAHGSVLFSHNHPFVPTPDAVEVFVDDTIALLFVEPPHRPAEYVI